MHKASGRRIIIFRGTDRPEPFLERIFLTDLPEKQTNRLLPISKPATFPTPAGLAAGGWKVMTSS
jgi:hypothetical protein